MERILVVTREDVEIVLNLFEFRHFSQAKMAEILDENVYKTNLYLSFKKNMPPCVYKRVLLYFECDSKEDIKNLYYTEIAKEVTAEDINTARKLFKIKGINRDDIAKTLEETVYRSNRYFSLEEKMPVYIYDKILKYFKCNTKKEMYELYLNMTKELKEKKVRRNYKTKISVKKPKSRYLSDIEVSLFKLALELKKIPLDKFLIDINISEDIFENSMKLNEKLALNIIKRIYTYFGAASQKDLYKNLYYEQKLGGLKILLARACYSKSEKFDNESNINEEVEIIFKKAIKNLDVNKNINALAVYKNMKKIFKRNFYNEYENYDLPKSLKYQKDGKHITYNSEEDMI